MGHYRHGEKLTDDQKRQNLADVLGVDVARLTSLSGNVCTRLRNAIANDPFLKDGEITWYKLMRTPNLGHRSAKDLCQALGLPIGRENPIAPSNENSYQPYQVASEVLHIIAAYLHRKTIIDKAVGSPECPNLVLTTSSGEEFRVRVERM